MILSGKALFVFVFQEEKITLLYFIRTLIINMNIV